MIDQSKSLLIYTITNNVKLKFFKKKTSTLLHFISISHSFFHPYKLMLDLY